MLHHGVYVIIFINMLTLPNLSVSQNDNKMSISSYPHIDSVCYHNAINCLKGENVSFKGIPEYSSNYSKLIQYQYKPEVATQNMYPIDTKVQSVISLFYQNTEDLRVFLSLRSDINGTWERTLSGVSGLRTETEEDRQYTFCDGTYKYFYCSPHTKNCSGSKIDLTSIQYVNSIFSENVAEISFKGKPSLEVQVKLFVYNDITSTYRVVTIPLNTPALLDVMFNAVYRMLYRDPSSHALLKAFKSFFARFVGEPYRGPRNNKFTRVWQKNGSERMGNAIL
ncbi:envelope glycoprotein L [Elephant endotheliotropic herpesvirus 2]|nr:glycoprotein L [Elephant endotheliotropic herpesvirus 2]AGZ17124.1 envelope glycoprotein L [Elephant endotheliotropic herpesvirus 2]AID07079.1 envelope glycoprotein L [Elephant endotheliotropic herpesvirus 2]UEH20548.1 envelope glycoprotein L [Elephant endotheliotropic herpesvirus 2]